ncbi:MAG: hypothetical protein LBT59_17095 [Clostridiales bacterium]|nr:hypothetical protein [Clostridiales bacterium]
MYEKRIPVIVKLDPMPDVYASLQAHSMVIYNYKHLLSSQIENNVAILTDCPLMEVAEHGIYIKCKTKLEMDLLYIKRDTVILAVGVNKDRALWCPVFLRFGSCINIPIMHHGI